MSIQILYACKKHKLKQSYIYSNEYISYRIQFVQLEHVIKFLQIRKLSIYIKFQKILFLFSIFILNYIKVFQFTEMYFNKIIYFDNKYKLPMYYIFLSDYRLYLL